MSVEKMDCETIKGACYQAIATLLDSGAVKATKYVSPKSTVKAKLKEFKNGAGSLARTQEILLTFGAPNYEEREAIKKFKKAGEPFPVKRVQLKFAKPKAGVKRAA